MDETMLSGAELNKRSHIVYDFVDCFTEYEDMRKDYGDNEVFSMTEVHMLEYIDHNPGITATELAAGYRRSKSLISKMVNMFEARGYLIRVPDASDGKKRRLFLSVKGKRLCEEHVHYDELNRRSALHALLERCSEEDIDTFYRVMTIYTEHIKSEWFRKGMDRNGEK